MAHRRGLGQNSGHARRAPDAEARASSAPTIQLTTRARGRRPSPTPPRISALEAWAPSTAQVATIKRTLRVLDALIDDRPTLRALALSAQMGRSQFSHMFHAVSGVPFRTYLSCLRLKKAEKLLRTSRKALRTIAKESGFYDLAHLDKAFRKRFGISPSQFLEAK